MHVEVRGEGLVELERALRQFSKIVKKSEIINEVKLKLVEKPGQTINIAIYNMDNEELIYLKEDHQYYFSTQITIWRKQDFKDLCKFVEHNQFDRLGIFTYSHEDGTHAGTMVDDVPQEVKEERAAIVMEIQQGISAKINQQKVGNTFS